MPRPPRHGLTRAGRMVRVLRYLADHGGSASSIEVRAGMAGYSGESGHRLWRMDLRELRLRGLVRAHEPGEELSSRVELMPMLKPRDLFLTRAEHAVLARATDL